MSPALPVVSGRELIRAHERAGFHVVRQSGSHVVVRRDDPFGQVVVPDHRVLDRGTLRAILRQADISVEKLIGLL